MATVRERFRKDGSKVFQVQIRLRGQKPTTMTFKRKTDAQKWIQNTESAIREGRYFKKSESRRHTVRELIDRYIEVELPHKPKMKKEQHAESWCAYFTKKLPVDRAVCKIRNCELNTYSIVIEE